MDIKERIKAQEWWVKQLKLLTWKVIGQEAKRRERVQQKNADALSEYKNANEIQEAYGMGIITEKKYEKLLDMWEESYGSESKTYEYEVDILEDVFQEAKRVLEELKGEKDHE